MRVLFSVWKTNGYPNRKSKLPGPYQYGNYQLVFSNCFGIRFSQINALQFAGHVNINQNLATLDKTVSIILFSVVCRSICVFRDNFRNIRCLYSRVPLMSFPFFFSSLWKICQNIVFIRINRLYIHIINILHAYIMY